MDEMEFDRTRKSLRVQELGKSDRKEMMQKLSGAGGQVLSERALREKKEEEERQAREGRGGTGGSGRGRGRGGEIEGPKLPSQLARERARSEADRDASARRQRELEENEARGVFARFSIKFRCWMAGVTPYGSDLVQPKALSLFNLDAKRAIMECQILGNDLFMNNKRTAQTIMRELDQKNPILVELIERASKLYDRGELSELIGSYTPGSRIPVALDSIRAPVFSLLRKLYYLRPFQETYLTAVDQAIDIQQREEKKQAALYVAKKKKIRAEWKTLMSEVYPALVMLAQRAEMLKAEPGTRLFDEMVGLLDSDRPGTRKTGDGVGAKAEDKTDGDGADGDAEKKDENKEPAQPTQEDKELQYGYRIMKIFTADVLRRKHDSKGDLKSLKDTDKVLIAYLFFREFEEEYSFILTTPKLKIEPSYTGGVKLDYREKMRDLFDEARMIHDAFKSYHHEATEYNKIVNEHVEQSRYVEHAKKVELLESRRGPSGREARIQVKEYMGRVAGILKELIADMRGPNKIVTNREDVIQFDMERDRRKRLNGKPIKDCVMQAYCFSIGLQDRLEGGDLFGGVIEMDEEEFANAFAS